MAVPSVLSSGMFEPTSKMVVVHMSISISIMPMSMASASPYIPASAAAGEARSAQESAMSAAERMEAIIVPGDGFEEKRDLQAGRVLEVGS